MNSTSSSAISGVPAYVLHVCDVLRAAGYEAFAVGGGVRDALLGRRPDDWDVTTDAPPERVQQLFPRTVATGVRFGTVTVLGETASVDVSEPADPEHTVSKPVWTVEVTTFRGESGYADGRRPDDVQFIGDIEDDLVRRDFTVNAIAYDPLSNRLVDPHGGQADLERRVLRAVGDADARFREDGLRLLRAIRLATELAFDIESNTGAALRRNGAALENISRERIGDEWRRMLLSSAPGRSVRLLYEYDLLRYVLVERKPRPHKKRVPAKTAFAEQDRASFSPSPTPKTISDVAEALGRAPEADIIVRSAIALHGLGPAAMHRPWLNGLVYPKRVIRDVVAITTPLSTFRFEDVEDEVALRRFLSELGRQRIESFFLALAGWHCGEQSTALRRRAERIAQRGDALHPSELALDGGDVQRLLGVQPGPRVGRLLERLFQHVLQHPRDNTESRLTGLLFDFDAEASP